MEVVKRSLVARGWRRGGMNRTQEFQGSENTLIIMTDKSLHICLNPQNMQQE